MEKIKVIMALAVFIISFVFLNVFSIYYFDLALSPVAITGKVVESGNISLYVDTAKVLTIHSPINDTYGFSILANYSIDLNVSADFLVDSWRYSLYDLTHSEYNVTNVSFTPNDSISAVRWGNRLTVEAYETEGGWISKEVVFYVQVGNSAPILGAINDSILFCEGAYGNYLFNATDVDEEDLSVDLSDKDPLYVGTATSRVGDFTVFRLIGTNFGGVLSKEDAGGIFAGFKLYPENISVSDGEFVDTAQTNVTVIEINNIPSMVGLGAQTVYLNGTGSSFNYQMDVADTENGTSSGGELRFNLTIDGDLFDINLTTGIMNYTPVLGQEDTVYSATVCVNDTSLPSPHPNISICGVDGGVNVVCDGFTISVTDENRLPVIENYTPTDLDFSVGGTTATVFTVSVSDADRAPSSPDIDWYVDDVLKERNENKSSDSFSYSFGCGVSGDHDVSAVTTDGIANDTVVWDISVSVVACPVSSSGGGGGGGGYLSGFCREEWACNSWQVCQNVERTFDFGSMSLEDYSDYKGICLQNGYDERFCGFQLTECFDLARCNNTEVKIPKPIESQNCYYTENPSCTDGITNCHDGGCELLVDCGGPCGVCPSCSDGIQNQGEGNIDCGGPCPFLCEIESPISSISYTIIILGILAFSIFLFILYRLIRIIYNLWLSGFFGKGRKKKI